MSLEQSFEFIYLMEHVLINEKKFFIDSQGKSSKLISSGSRIVEYQEEGIFTDSQDFVKLPHLHALSAKDGKMLHVCVS